MIPTTSDDTEGSHADALIAEVMAPQPIEVRVLGRVLGRVPKVQGLDGDASAKLEAIVATSPFTAKCPRSDCARSSGPQATAAPALAPR